tara:strand:+ start:7711 stop:8091 length:381 start_codon:yes stop_codon:yes gene_type:complete
LIAPRSKRPLRKRWNFLSSTVRSIPLSTADRTFPRQTASNFDVGAGCGGDKFSKTGAIHSSEWAANGFAGFASCFFGEENERDLTRGWGSQYALRQTKRPSGGLAQLGERLHGMQEVIGSSPLSSI